MSAKLAERREEQRGFLEQLMDPSKVLNYRVPIPVDAQLRKYQQVCCMDAKSVHIVLMLCNDRPIVWFSLLTTFINSLWPSDAMWWQRIGSTLAQVMACCLMAPSHHLNQCWLIMNLVLWHPPENNFIGISQNINLKNEFETYNFKIIPTSPSGQWLNSFNFSYCS